MTETTKPGAGSAENASPAETAPEAPKPITIEKGSTGRYHYLMNGPRRANCTAKVEKVHKATKKAPETYDIRISATGGGDELTKLVEGVRRFDPKTPNCVGFQPIEEIQAASKKPATDETQG